MFISRKTELFVLVAGDLISMVLALWFTLAVRYGGPVGEGLLITHALAFAPVFFLWIIGYYIFNLYGKLTVARERTLPRTILQAQVWNSVVAALVFYFIPRFGVTPKTNLFIDLALSFIFILTWRILIVPRLLRRKPEHLLVVGDGPETEELVSELRDNHRYDYTLHRVLAVSNSADVRRVMGSYPISAIIFRQHSVTEQRALAELGLDRLFNVRLLDKDRLYENLFDRVPLSQVNEQWYFEYGSLEVHGGYALLKRTTDIVVALMLGLLSLVVYPFVWLAIKIDDGGRVFIVQERIGLAGVVFGALKLRTMSSNDNGEWGNPGKDARVTRVGRILRASRIDELPQLWNVLVGDLSLVGPRPDIIALGKRLADDIPYYRVRTMVQPGLSGWAQINQDLPPRSTEETRERLTYDFYYLKHRSFWLDVKILLRTVKTLLSRSGL